ncbi:MAG: helix-turn-helix domain-containing protein [Methanofollis liminatans]|nr:helix-turn-helix domain-containing protein [Methanofollis liminatans]
MKLPCETGVWIILPCIRACLVQELTAKGLSQKKVSTMLGITPASVSQYTSKKRGCTIELCNDAIASIQQLADDLITDNVEHMGLRMCDICMQVRSQGVLDEGEDGPCIRDLVCNLSSPHGRHHAT